jgi:hypothetical protein
MSETVVSIQNFTKRYGAFTAVDGGRLDVRGVDPTRDPCRCAT